MKKRLKLALTERTELRYSSFHTAICKHRQSYHDNQLPSLINDSRQCQGRIIWQKRIDKPKLVYYCRQGKSKGNCGSRRRALFAENHRRLFIIKLLSMLSLILLR